MNEQLRAIAELDRAIHEPGRMMIITLLASVAECDFLYLLRETELAKGNLSSHLSKLEQAGYVEIEKTYAGKVPRTVVRLTAAGRRAFEGYRKGLNLALAEQLKTSAEAAEARQAREREAAGVDLIAGAAGLAEMS